MKQINIQNVSRLPLQCVMKVQYPFSLVVDGGDDGHVCQQQQQVTIEGGETFDLTVQFDPKFKKDRFIRTAESKLDISYVDHPSTDWVALRGDVFYPNLKFEFDEVSLFVIPVVSQYVKHFSIWIFMRYQAPLNFSFS